MSTIDNIPLLFQITAAALSDRDNQILQQALSIGLAQYKVLAVLAAKGKTTQKDIARILDQTEASVSRQVQTMYDDGLVKTQPKTGDRRVHVTVLTPRGKRIAKRAETILAKQNKQLFGALSATQRKQLGEILRALRPSV